MSSKKIIMDRESKSGEEYVFCIEISEICDCYVFVKWNWSDFL